MKVVIDTNVFISGIFFSGPPSRILEAWKNRRFEIVLSRQIISEYQRVAEELSSKFPAIDIMPIIEMLTIHGTFVDIKNRGAQVVVHVLQRGITAVAHDGEYRLEGGMQTTVATLVEGNPLLGKLPVGIQLDRKQVWHIHYLRQSTEILANTFLLSVRVCHQYSPT